MKVANLQLQGLLMAIASINNVLVQKGILSIDEIDTALHKAETNLTSEELSTKTCRRPIEMRLAFRSAF